MGRGDMSNNWGNGKCVPQIHPSKRWGMAKDGDMAWKQLSTSKVHREIAVSNGSNLSILILVSGNRVTFTPMTMKPTVC